VFIVRPLLCKMLRWTGNLTEEGPSNVAVTFTLLLVLSSAFFTQVLGIHAIFGAFLVGIICPTEGKFAEHILDKVDSLVAALLLPLYFALSGLSTNLGLLNSGKAWGYLIAIVVIAFVGKVSGAMFGARATGLVWRESAAIGVLMSCKGLVELIVLNIGLQAQILTTQTFTIFVVMAVVTTCLTAPIVSWLYPPEYRARRDAKRAALSTTDTATPVPDGKTDSGAPPSVRRPSTPPPVAFPRDAAADHV